MAERIRSFIALDVDDEQVVKRFSEAQQMLVRTGADLKLITPPMVDSVHEAIQKISFSQFDVAIQGLGAFPKLQYARVIWAGIKNGAEQLSNVSDQLEPRLGELGFRPDSKGFSPHLTIARVKSGRNKPELIRCIKDAANYEFGIIKAECLRLKRSVLTPRGPIYSTIREVKAT
jgi:2'-5' RNA ligase